jgi:hypothetical protein
MKNLLPFILILLLSSCEKEEVHAPYIHSIRYEIVTNDTARCWYTHNSGSPIDTFRGYWEYSFQDTIAYGDQNYYRCVVNHNGFDTLINYEINYYVDGSLVHKYESILHDTLYNPPYVWNGSGFYLP